MLDRTRTERLREFNEISRGVRPNTPEHLAAQEYFKREIMMLPKEITKNPHFVAKQEDTTLQGSFVESVFSLVNHINQNELFSTSTYDEAVARLPEEDRNKSRGIGSVLHRLALQFRAREVPLTLGYGK